ncbi:MAG: hypothetical protein AAF961_18500 [Planctomycetota bacterium]
MGTQIAAEDVSGVPRIVGERSVFCPPRILIPEDRQPFRLFLDELPASSPDVQKAFYSLLLERRLGEPRLPRGTWVVAAGKLPPSYDVMWALIGKRRDAFRPPYGTLVHVGNEAL